MKILISWQELLTRLLMPRKPPMELLKVLKRLKENFKLVSKRELMMKMNSWVRLKLLGSILIVKVTRRRNRSHLLCTRVQLMLLKEKELKQELTTDSLIHTTYKSELNRITTESLSRNLELKWPLLSRQSSLVQ
jgi:hypothetical protein